MVVTVIPGLSKEQEDAIAKDNKPKINKIESELNSLKSIIKDCQKRIDKLEPLVHEMATWY